MSNQKADLILHPVRMQILKIIGGREMTPGQLSDALPDISRATVYRHINALADGGLLIVVGENPIRGTVEKVYTLADAALTRLTAEELQSATKDDHLRYFTIFATSLLSDFGQYLNSQDHLDYEHDTVGYHTVALNLSDNEIADFTRRLNEAIQPFLQNQPSSERKRLLFSTVIMPSVNESSIQESEEKP